MRQQVMRALGVRQEKLAAADPDGQAGPDLGDMLIEAAGRVGGYGRQFRRDVFLTVMAELTRKGHNDRILTLWQAMTEFYPQLVWPYVDALYNAGLSGAALEAAVIDLEARQALPKDLRMRLLDFRNRAQIGYSASHYTLLWGEVPETIEDGLKALRPDMEKALYPEECIDLLMGVRPDFPGGRAAFLRQLHWGQAATEYLRFLSLFKEGLQHLGRSASDLSVADQAVWNLCQQLPDLYDRVETGLLSDAVASGRSILIARAHAGPPNFAFNEAFGMDLPAVIVNARDHTDLSGPGNLLFGTSNGKGTFQFDFLKLIKRIRARQYQIHVFPDGGHGGDQRECELLGLRIHLPQGAAVMAYMSQSATFFCGAFWKNGRIVPYIRPGPVAEPETPREDFERAFHAFYVDCLKEILLSAPEDLVGRLPPMLERKDAGHAA